MYHVKEFWCKYSFYLKKHFENCVQLVGIIIILYIPLVKYVTREKFHVNMCFYLKRNFEDLIAINRN
jgi:hypothetical protein